MESINLKVTTRDPKVKVKNLRNEGIIPAVLYGREIDNTNLSLDKKTFSKIYRESGSSVLLDLEIDKKEPFTVLIQDIQHDPVTDQIFHVDFYKVKMDEKIETEVELEFEGISPAVKEDGGVLVKNFDELEISCLPADLPKEIIVDISVLKTFDDVIKIKDLNISDKVEVMRDLESVVATVTPPRSEEELEQLDEEVTEDVDAVEGVKDTEPEEAEADSEGAEKTEAEADKEKPAEAPAEEKKEG